MLSLSRLSILLGLLTLFAVDARYVEQQVWIKSAVVPGPYCFHGDSNPPPDYVIFTPIGVCESHNVRETYNGYDSYSIMYTYNNNRLKLHYYNGTDCSEQTSVKTINMANTCQYYAEENPRYLAEYSYVKFSLSNNIKHVYDDYSYSITVYDSTTPACDGNSLLYNIQYSPYTCILAGRAGPHETNGRCTPSNPTVNSYFCEDDSTCSDLSQCTANVIDTANDQCELGDNLDMIVGGVDRSKVVQCLAPAK